MIWKALTCSNGKNFLMKLSSVLIIYRNKSAIAKETALFCENLLKSQKITVIKLSSNFDSKTLKKSLEINDHLPEIVIVLGGDGTVLKSSNELFNFNIPILSFNIGGNLGFLTQDRKFLDNKSFIDLLKRNEFKIDERTMLQCNHYEKILIDAQKFNKSEFYALNDFYFKSIENDISPTNRIRIEINDEKVNEYKGDGLIISSATGSTAYSMAAGGPIVHPLINAFVINAICPMSLSSRPIVIPDTSKVLIKNINKENNYLQLWKDGTKCLILQENDFCEIKKAPKPVKMISLNDNISYYSTLIKKLEWRGNLS